MSPDHDAFDSRQTMNRRFMSTQAARFFYFNTLEHYPE